MYVVPKQQTSVTLFGRDGYVRIFKTRREALRELGASFIRYHVGPNLKTARLYHDLERSWGSQGVTLYAYFMLDDSGKSMSIADFKDLLGGSEYAGRRAFGDYGVSHPGRKPSNGSIFRHPKTIAEKRLCSLVAREDLEPAVRAKRKPPQLPDTRDDLWLCREKSWKSHRKTQYKEKGML